MYESAPFSEKLAQLETHHTTVSGSNGGPQYDGIYACIDIPSLLLGTVGGGTSLATQKESLNLMGCHGKVRWIFVPMPSTWSGFSPENLRGGKNCSSISKIYEHFMAFVLFSTGK